MVHLRSLSSPISWPRARPEAARLKNSESALARYRRRLTRLGKFNIGRRAANASEIRTTLNATWRRARALSS